MHLTTAQSSAIVAAIYLGFCLIELIRTRLFAKGEQSRHDGIIEIVSTFMLLIVTSRRSCWSSARSVTVSFRTMKARSRTSPSSPRLRSSSSLRI